MTIAAHKRAHSVEKGGAGVLHEMPEIRNLDGIRKGLGGGFAIAELRRSAKSRIERNPEPR